MVLHATIMRSHDGLPLSATNNSSGDYLEKAKEPKEMIKVISKHLHKLPQRACIQGNNYTAHSLKDNGTSYIVVCDPNYPHILAYSFLDELVQEFSVLYTASVISSVKRPFGFVEFEGYLGKVQLKYNSPQNLASRINLADMTNNLNINPPVYMKLSDLEPPILPPPKPKFQAISIPNGDVPNVSTNSKASPGIQLRLAPLSFLGYLVLVLVLCAMFVDFHRSFTILSEYFDNDEISPSLLYGVSFIIEMGCLFLQTYHYLFYTKFRKKISVCLCGAVFVTNFLLYELRDMSVVAFYLGLSLLLVWLTFKRKFQRIVAKNNI